MIKVSDEDEELLDEEAVHLLHLPDCLMAG